MLDLNNDINDVLEQIQRMISFLKISNKETSQLFDQLDTMKNDLKSCQNLFETNKKTTPSAKLITMTKLRIDEIKKETNKIEINVKNKIFLNEFNQFKQKIYLTKQVSFYIIFQFWSI